MNGDDRRNGGHTNGYSARRLGSQRPVSGSSPGRSLPPPAPVLETKPRLSGDLRAPSPHASPRIPTPISSVLVSESSLSSASSLLNVPDSYSSPLPGGYSPAGPRSDHFNRARQQTSSTAATILLGSGSGTLTTSSDHLDLLKKKKPPPPPPPPRPNPAAFQAVYVTALYDFGGQGPGDLAFREGDRIRVLKRTDSTDDWWEGELRGVRGSFPANYCR